MSPFCARAGQALRTVAAIVALGLGSAASAAPRLEAPNVVPVSDRLVTAGQPTAATLRTLGAQGFDAVVYLAPTTVADAVPDERAIVESQGLRWVHIPIRFEGPTDADLAAFFAAMERNDGRRVLVHCQLNFRASTFAFLYRTLVRRESPDRAYEDLARVWSPDGPWRAFIVRQLKLHRIDFDPY